MFPYIYLQHLEVMETVFFRSISWYMTGSEDQHSEVRQLMINHVMRNYEAIKAFSGKNEEYFREWIRNKASTSGSVKHEDTHWADDDRTTHWADTDCMVTMSPLLKTTIYSYTPQMESNMWLRLDGSDAIIGAQNYGNIFYNMNRANIYLDNRGEHFEPAFINTAQR